jgi:hypothetical protein
MSGWPRVSFLSCGASPLKLTYVVSEAYGPITPIIEDGSVVPDEYIIPYISSSWLIDSVKRNRHL